MDEMIAYIFENLRSSEKSFKRVSRFIRSQNRTNKSVAIFITAATAYIVAAEIRRVDMETRLTKLKKGARRIKTRGRRLKCDD